MVAVNETSGAAVAGSSPNSKEASPTKVEEQRQEYIVLKQEHKVSYRCSLPLQKRSKDQKGMHKSSASFQLLSFLHYGEVFQTAEKLLKIEEYSEAQNLQNVPIRN